MTAGQSPSAARERVGDPRLENAEVIIDPDDERMFVFTGLSDQQLRQQREAPGGDLQGVFIAEGDVVIQRAIDAGHRLLSVIVEARRTRPLEFELGEAPLYRMGEPVVERIASHRRYRGAMACFERPKAVDPAQLLNSLDGGPATVVVTEGVNNPTNLGVIIRTAAALGVDAILGDVTSCDPLARRTNRVSMGAVFAVPHARLGAFPAGLGPLEAAGFRTLALVLDPAATPLDEVDLGHDERVALLFGAEQPGLTKATIERATDNVTIPMHHGVDSLNVATAAAIAMWHRQSSAKRR